MKVLIISHNSFSSFGNMGKTFASLFSSFRKEEICQLYIHGSIPDLDVCSSYYRITDEEVLKGLFTFSVNGSVIEPKKDLIANETGAHLKKKKKGYFRHLIRDLIWKRARWYNRDLEKWIEKENPTCIFVAIGGDKFLYDIAIKISQKHKLPIAVYVCDNYYAFVQKGFFGRVWLNQLRKKTKQLIACSACVITISNSMKKYYEEHFNIPSFAIMTGASTPSNDTFVKCRSAKVFRFFGNTTMNRFKSLASICKVIDEINEEENDSISLEIYSKSVTKEEKAEFAHIRCAKFMGFLFGHEYKERFLSSDVLVHVESFDERMIERVKYSISTKIGDCLTSGIPLFIYGPASVASVNEFINENLEFICTDYNSLKPTLKRIIYDQSAREKAVKKQFDVAKKFYDRQSNSLHLYKTLSLIGTLE